MDGEQCRDFARQRPPNDSTQRYRDTEIVLLYQHRGTEIFLLYQHRGTEVQRLFKLIGICYPDAMSIRICNPINNRNSVA